MPQMSRRELFQTSGVVLGGTLVASSALFTACTAQRNDQTVARTAAISTDDQQLLEEMADTILPTTPASPGAKAAGVGPAIALLLTDCYDTTAQERAAQGLAAFRALCHDRCGGAFTKLSPSQRETLLAEVDADATRTGDAHWFHLVHELSRRAYFSSEIGMTKALRYVRVPGHWTGCVPLEPAQPAWG